MVAKYLMKRLVPMVVSSPGIGKSQMAQAVADKFNLKLIDIRLAQCDPTDLNGFPQIENGKASYIPMDTFPLEGDHIPDGYSGWLLLFDELTSAVKATQAAAYKIILDRAVGLNKLHKNVAMMAAGNLSTDNAIVEEMSTALRSRMVHIQVGVDAKEFIDWGIENDIDHRITSFIEAMPDKISTFNPDHSEETYACPRTWEFANRILKDADMSDPDLLPMLAGTVSEPVARELMVFFKIHADLPKFAAIEANPIGIPMPDGKSILFALTSSIAYQVGAATIHNIMKFVKRMPVEFQVTTLRQIIKRDKKMLSHADIQEWIATSATKLF